MDPVCHSQQRLHSNESIYYATYVATLAIWYWPIVLREMYENSKNIIRNMYVCSYIVIQHI